MFSLVLTALKFPKFPGTETTQDKLKINFFFYPTLDKPNDLCYDSERSSKIALTNSPKRNGCNGEYYYGY